MCMQSGNWQLIGTELMILILIRILTLRPSYLHTVEQLGPQCSSRHTTCMYIPLVCRLNVSKNLCVNVHFATIPLYLPGGYSPPPIFRLRIAIHGSIETY